MEIPIFQVDAFSDRVFSGNPAAVCPLTEWLPDTVLQAIAAENNLAETAYLVPDGSRYQLRWFTPTCEVELCGHATLASSFVLFHKLNHAGKTISFDTKSGKLTVTREGDRLTLDFPSWPPSPVQPELGLIEAVGGKPLEILAARDVVLVYATEAEVLALAPDMHALTRLKHFGFIVTAPGTKSDFVSRFFAPAKGIDEDPVTGSAHCTLIPYWAAKLGKTELFARQTSRRGGELYCQLAGDRVKISGRAAACLEGTIQVPVNGA